MSAKRKTPKKSLILKKNDSIEKLIKIQDFLFMLKENDIIQKNKETHSSISAILNKEILKIQKSLPGGIVANYDRIAKKYGSFVVPMVNETCTSCFMKLPIGLANDVKNPSKCIACPSCNLFLFEDYQIPSPENNYPNKGVARFSSINLMVPELKGKKYTEVIAELAKVTGQAGFVEKGDDFKKELLYRENFSSTTTDVGIAFPSARGTKGVGLTLTFGISPEGIEVGEGKLVHLFFVFSVPHQNSVFFLEILSTLNQYFRKKTNFDKALACRSPEAMWKILMNVGT